MAPRTRPIYAVALITFVMGVFGYVRHENYASMVVINEKGETTLSVNKVIANISDVECGPLSRFSSPQGGYHRTHWKVSEQDAGGLPQIYIRRRGDIVTGSEVGFDLWDIAERLKAAPNSDLILSFSVYSHQSEKCVLALGSDDITLISVNEKTIFATLGKREFIRGENLVPIQLKAGINSIRILSRKALGWKGIPVVHWDDQWQLSIDLFTSEPKAWSFFRTRNYHLVDTPIVTSLNDFNTESEPGANTTVFLMDCDGKVAAQGVTGKSGSILWRGNFTKTPYFGFLVMGSASEPVLITQNSELEKFCQDAQKHYTSAEDVRPWRVRLNHLLEAKFEADRDYWWSRKVMLSLAFILTNGSQSSQSLLSLYKASSIRFKSYASSIDYTTQYYRISRRDDNRPQRSLIVMLPSVGSTTRKYLESSQVSDLYEAESEDSLARDLEVDVLWPGIVDVDYGGDLNRAELDECLNSVREESRDTKYCIYLLGSCSSGVSALHYAETRNISGVMLQSPVISRSTNRWFSNIAVQDVRLPVDFLQPEETTNKIGELIGLPIFLTFSKDIPGHGDRSGSVWLCSQLRERKSPLTEKWPKAVNEVLWGERLRLENQQMFVWAKSKLYNSHKSESLSHSLLPPTSTVKSALLKGFSVQTPHDSKSLNWIRKWATRWSLFRGQEFIMGDFPLKGTVVVSKVIDQDQLLREIELGAFSEGIKYDLNPLAPKTDRGDELWGFRLVSSTNDTVEVLRTSNTNLCGPDIDLLVDGCCKGAIWRRIGGSWVLVFAWL